MTVLVNDRDVLIQNTVPRFTPPTDRALLVDSDGQVFKVSGAGAGSPTSITFTAKLLNMTGAVDWSATGGSTLTVNGNTAVLEFTDMVGEQTTVTASITVDGQPYTSGQVVTKISDGVTGDSSRRAYTKTSLTSLSSVPTTLTTAGDTSYPPPDSWGAGTVWGGSPPTLGANERLFQSDSTYSAVSDTTTWEVPYMSSLKVGQLSAITADLGSITAGDIYSTTIHGGIGYPTNAYAWPTNGGDGYHLSSDGLLFGNANLGKYTQIEASGNIRTPEFTSIDGAATFSGALSAASGTFAGELSAATGTFSGKLTADAIDAVKTINVAGQAITQTLTATGTSSASVTIVTTGGPIQILCQGQGTGYYSQATVGDLTLTRNGSVISTGGYINYSGDQLATGQLLWIDNVPAGAYTYQISNAIHLLEGGSPGTAYSCLLSVLETKR